MGIVKKILSLILIFIITIIGLFFLIKLKPNHFLNFLNNILNFICEYFFSVKIIGCDAYWDKTIFNTDLTTDIQQAIQPGYQQANQQANQQVNPPANPLDQYDDISQSIGNPVQEINLDLSQYNLSNINSLIIVNYNLNDKLKLDKLYRYIYILITDAFTRKYFEKKNLIKITNLPKNIKILYVNGIRLTEINENYDNLERISCSNCELSKNKYWPKKLKSLNCMNNNIEILENLPNDLEFLSCGYNEIDNLDSLPSKIEYLDCTKNKITILDCLPPKIKDLLCGYNRLKELNNLPSGLITLNCSNNLIYNLDYLPNSLIKLDCSYNNFIKNLDNLPNGLKWLVCTNCTELQKICYLPINLEFIELESCDKLSIIDKIPCTIRYFNSKNNFSLEEIKFNSNSKNLFHIDIYPPSDITKLNIIESLKLMDLNMKGKKQCNIIYPKPNYLNLNFYYRSLSLFLSYYHLDKIIYQIQKSLKIILLSLKFEYNHRRYLIPNKYKLFVINQILNILYILIIALELFYIIGFKSLIEIIDKKLIPRV